MLKSRYSVLVSIALFLVATPNDENVSNASERPSVAQKVREILLDTTGDDSAIGRGDTIAGRVQKLEALGREALPHVTETIPQLGPTSLVAAAWLLADAGYESAAEPLAARLDSPLENPEEGWDSWNPQYALLRALGRLGGDHQAPIVEGVLTDTSRHGAVRRQALATLVSIGSVRTMVMASRFVDETSRSSLSGWRPPFAVDDIDAGKNNVTVTRDGSRFVAFVDPYLGSLDDVWIIESGPDASFHTPSLFLGRLDGAGEEDATLSARIVGTVIEVGIAGEESSLLRVDLTRARLDSDGDGIPDLAEKRMRLDPLRRDTDGDGLDDGLDPAPNAHSGLEETEDGRIRLAVFRQFYLFEREADRGLAVIDAPLEWRGRNEPTIALAPEEQEQFNEEVGFNGITRVGIESLADEVTEDNPVFGLPDRPLRDDERLYALVFLRGPLDAVGYRVLVRRFQGRWFIAELDVVFVA